MVAAASRGDLREAQRLRAAHPDLEWPGPAATCAASGGHLETLRWLRQAGCPFNEYVLFAAAKHNRIHVLEWLGQWAEPTPLDQRALLWAGDCPEAAEWLLLRGCECTAQTARLISDRGQFAALELIWTHRPALRDLVRDERAATRER